ncbi:MAG: tetratricopeptide repeat protein [bacterium]
MKFKQKILLIISILCLYLFFLNITNITYSQENPDYKKQFNIRISQENFADFSESLIIPDLQEKLTLDKAFFSSLNFKSDFSSLDMLSLNKEEKSDFQISAEEEKNEDSVQNNFNQDYPPNIYKIKLSALRSNNNNPINAMIMIDKNKLSGNDFRKIIETSKDLIKEGNISQAETILDNTILKIQANSWFLAESAGIFEQIGNFNKAGKTYERAVLINPNRIELLYSYAICLYKNNQFDKAEKILTKVVLLDPKFMLAYYNLGNIYYKKNQYFKALDSFNKSVKLNPLNADAYYNLALTLEVLNYKNLALKYYFKCLELKPEDAQAQKALKRINS